MKSLIDVLRGQLHIRLDNLRSKQGFLYHVTVLTGGSIIGVTLVVLVSPILTRLYPPVALGALTVYGSMVSILSVIGALRYEIAIPLPEDDAVAANVLGLSLTVLLAMSVITAVLISLFGDWIVQHVKAPILRPYLWLLPLGMVGVSVYQIFTFWALRRGAFTRIARTKLSQSVGMVVTQIGLGVLKVGPVALLLGDFVGRANGVGSLAGLAWQQDRDSLKKINLAGMRDVAIRYRRFPLFSSWAALLNAVGLELPMLLVAALYGSQVLGWLALGQRIMVIPLSLLANAMYQVYYGESAKVAHKHSEQLPLLFWKILGGMAAVSLPYVGLLALLAPIVFPIVFGNQWLESGGYVRLIAPMVFVQSIASPTGGALDVLERQDLHLVREIMRVFFFICAFVAIRIFGLNAKQGVLGISLAGTLSYIVFILISYYAIRKAGMRTELQRE